MKRLLRATVGRKLAPAMGDKVETLLECLHRVSASTPFVPGEKLLQFRLDEVLGQGASSAVVKATDTRLGRPVALKIMLLTQTTAEEQRRFTQEARRAASMNHPNLALVHDIRRTKKMALIVMEYIPGRTLEEVLRTRFLSPPVCLNLSLQIAKALVALHANGIVHQDLKPSNVLVTQDGVVKVIDIGSAKSSWQARGGDDRSLLEDGALRGTPAYMSPEQVRDEAIDARSDIFSFGALFFEMMTGQKAFRRMSLIETVAAILHESPAVRSLSVPKVMTRILNRCLSKDPSLRFQTAQHLYDGLQKADLSIHSAGGPIRSNFHPSLY